MRGTLNAKKGMRRPMSTGSELMRGPGRPSTAPHVQDTVGPNSLAPSHSGSRMNSRPSTKGGSRTGSRPSTSVGKGSIKVGDKKSSDKKSLPSLARDSPLRNSAYRRKKSAASKVAAKAQGKAPEEGLVCVFQGRDGIVIDKNKEVFVEAYERFKPWQLEILAYNQEFKRQYTIKVPFEHLHMCFDAFANLMRLQYREHLVKQILPFLSFKNDELRLDLGPIARLGKKIKEERAKRIAEGGTAGNHDFDPKKKIRVLGKPSTDPFPPAPASGSGGEKDLFPPGPTRPA